MAMLNLSIHLQCLAVDGSMRPEQEERRLVRTLQGPVEQGPFYQVKRILPRIIDRLAE